MLADPNSLFQQEMHIDKMQFYYDIYLQLLATGTLYLYASQFTSDKTSLQVTNITLVNKLKC